jgi:tRNA pseudouridine55 synthase
VTDKTDYKLIPLVFNVYKPVGPSSFGIVQHFKKNLSYDFGKIGHFGTLDPFAEGVLLIGVQGAQKLNEYVHELLPKTYRAVGIFGGKTDSGDFMTEVKVIKHIDENFQEIALIELEEKLAKHFLGEYWQSPHSFSASKFEGKRLYQLAVQGKMIQKEKVKREILDFKILNYKYPEMEFQVTVSSGTYVRSLFEEIAELLGGHGALKVLERVAIGENLSSHSIREADWPKKGQDFDLEKWGTPLDQVLYLNKVRLNPTQTVRYLLGHRYPIVEVEVIKRSRQEEVSSLELYWMYNPEGHFLGLARHKDEEIQSIFNLKEAIALFT